MISPKCIVNEKGSSTIPGGRGFHGRLWPLKQIFPVSSFSYNKTTWAITWCFVHAQWIAMRAKKTRTDACPVLPLLGKPSGMDLQ